MEHQLQIDKLRETVIRMGEAAAISPTEALQFIDHLEQEIDRLTSELKRMKLDAARRSAAAGAMNSRLKDALRE